MKKTLLTIALLCAGTGVFAQRQMDELDRGLVAVKTSSGVYVSWRITGQEYYDTEYNLYRDGQKVNETPLAVSNFQDTGGSLDSRYTVKAVVRGVEQEPCAEVKPWARQYKTVMLDDVYSRDGELITDQYEANDISVADLDGDGEYELIVKRVNNTDAWNLFPVDHGNAFTVFEAYKLDGTKLWTIDCGPNMVSGSNVENNVVAYDWDGDGKAELLMRAADGTILPGGVVVGDIDKNYRNTISHSANMTYTNSGDEFLVYMEGATGKVYDLREYPLKRLEPGETDLNAAWGDGYGHRSSKYFFGAPFLDGRKPSIFLARGIYTRHKMIAYDVDPATHSLAERWRWSCNQAGSPWYGQGYHNYGIADVDLDGRDEIVYGSMVIDDNGQGLSTTGLGHGDAQHCTDLDPFTKGLEIFACLEDNPGSDYRNATTGKIRYRYVQNRDCGRCMAGNFTDDYMGSLLYAGTELTSSVTDKVLANGCEGVTQNFAIYWDGDLCRETMDYNGNKTQPAAVFKYGSWTPIFVADGTLTNNDTKGNPCVQADLLGDWREEMVLRTSDPKELRIYTTVTPTPWRNYTLLHDMQYRQAMVWQMCGYNQPPHVSYFLGQAEGITQAPPPLMTNGRVEAADAITVAHNDRHVLLADPQGGTVTVESGAAPYILTVNAFSHTEGATDNNRITTSYTAYTLQGAALGGDMRLVKQGEGELHFAGRHTYSGETSLWGGSVFFDGELPNSPVWVNRFAELNATGTFGRGIAMEYGAVLRPGGTDKKATVATTDLDLNYGSVLEVDIYSDDLTADVVDVTGTLTLRSIAVKNGPKYSAPVVRLQCHNRNGENLPAAGKYLIAKATQIEGDLDGVHLEGTGGRKAVLQREGGNIYLNILDLRDNTTVYWNGNAGNGTWDIALAQNFSNAGEPDIYVNGDEVVFDDSAVSFTVRVAEPVSPASILFNGTKTYTLTGDSIVGNASLTHSGSGNLIIDNLNGYTGTTLLSGGTTTVSSLANEQSYFGALGAYTTVSGRIVMQNNAVLRNTAAIVSGVPITLGKGGGTVNCVQNFDVKAPFHGDTLIKDGTGAMRLYVGSDHKRTVVRNGELVMMAKWVSVGDTLEMNGGVYRDCDSQYGYGNTATHFVVPRGKTATLYLDSRCTYTGRLKGAGTVKVNVPWIRTQLQGDWSAFEGTVEPLNTSNGLTLDNGFGMPKATLKLADGVTVTNSAKSFTVGAVTGNGTLGALAPFAGSGANTWRVGASGKNFTFAGSITGAGTAFAKVGTGQMTVSGYSDFSGACEVTEGTLCLNKANAVSAMLGTGVLTVKSGATLAGNGKLSNPTVIVQAKGVLRPGTSETATSGTIDMGGKNLTVQRNGVVQFNIGNSRRYTSLTRIGAANISGTVKVVMTEGATLSDGAELQLWQAETVKGTNPVFDLDSPGEGLEWDTAGLMESGVLRVRKATGISIAGANDTVDCQVIGAGGNVVDSFSCTYAGVQAVLDAAPVAGGTYIVRMTNAKGTVSQKFVKH